MSQKKSVRRVRIPIGAVREFVANPTIENLERVRFNCLPSIGELSCFDCPFGLGRGDACYMIDVDWQGRKVRYAWKEMLLHSGLTIAEMLLYMIQVVAAHENLSGKKSGAKNETP